MPVESSPDDPVFFGHLALTDFAEAEWLCRAAGDREGETEVPPVPARPRAA